MKLIMEWSVGDVESGKAEIDIPSVDQPADRYIKKMCSFIDTVNKLNCSLKRSKAVVTRRIVK